uniref:Proteasome assembly chaperone 4 n=1 Tax=Oryzias latipes TaxID=8090 RepID=A0A3P9IR26_ORYLA
MNGADFRGISVHNFSEKILEQVVHFHVMKLDGGFFLWVGSAPVLSNLAVSLNSKYDSMPLSTLVMGDPSETTASSLAQRLGNLNPFYHFFHSFMSPKKTKLELFLLFLSVSFNYHQIFLWKHSSYTLNNPFSICLQDKLHNSSVTHYST